MSRDHVDASEGDVPVFGLRWVPGCRTLDPRLLRKPDEPVPTENRLAGVINETGLLTSNARM